jgi:3',5'-cyclic AMP phosphodiesterase CpdA
MNEADGPDWSVLSNRPDLGWEPRMKIAQISDTHLTHQGGLTEENFRRLVEHFNEVARPDLVVITGDIQVIHPDVGADRQHAYTLASTLTVPFMAVPGNHDVGEPAEHPWAGLAVTDDRVAAYETTWGRSYWRHDQDGAVLIGLNSELMGSGLAREAEQWAWLERTVTELPTRAPVLVFLHKPVWAVLDEPIDHQLDLAPADRERLLALFEGTALRAVGSGHLHAYRHHRRGDVVEIWSPSTAFAAIDDHVMLDGLSEIGYVEYLVENGTVEANYRSIPGLTRATAMNIPQVAESLTAALAAAEAPAA